MRRFSPATIVEKHREAEDAITLTLEVPDELAEDYRYEQGQHLPVRAKIGDRVERRTYSICASVRDAVLRLGVRVQPEGVFSNYVADELDVGDTLEIMPPYGHFNTPLDPAQKKTYAAFVAGSGITPILSIAKTTLETEPESDFMVFYGNRKRTTTMFIEELWALKNRYPARLALHFLTSQEATAIELMAGRLDGGKVKALHAAFIAPRRLDEIFLCGPNPMIDDLTTALTEFGYDKERIHSERFRPGLKGQPQPRPRPSKAVPTEGTEVTVVMDGQQQSFHMNPDEVSILDAAEAQGIELPYSCKGAVCSTCRTLLRTGDVEMAQNYALEPWELERGFILACQARPTTATIEIDYDET